MSSNLKRPDMRTRTLLSLALALCAVAAPHRAAASGWVELNHGAPDFIQTFILLSDGSVLSEGTSNNWYRLVPDNTGSYINGTWQNAAFAHHTRTYFSSDVLPDGRVYVAGGEDGTGSDWVEIYDPVQDNWTPYGTNYFGGIADGESVVLNNGQVLENPQHTSKTYKGDTFLFQSK